MNFALDNPLFVPPAYISPKKISKTKIFLDKKAEIV